VRHTAGRRGGRLYGDRIHAGGGPIGLVCVLLVVFVCVGSCDHVWVKGPSLGRSAM